MIPGHRLVLLWFGLLVLLSSISNDARHNVGLVAALDAEEVETTETEKKDDNDDNTIQLNPGYVEPPESDDEEEEDQGQDQEENESNGDEETSGELEKDNQTEDAGAPSDSETNNAITSDKKTQQQRKKKKKKTKSVLSKALKQSRENRVGRSLRRHSGKIFLAATLYAFRRQFKSAVWNVISVPVYDRETGKVIKRQIRTDPTSWAKIAVFCKVVWDVQQQSPAAAHNGTRSLSLSSWFPFKNNAYLPSIQQHWTFQRINERYDKDSMAFDKAMGVPPEVRVAAKQNQTASSSSSFNTVTTAAALRRPLLAALFGVCPESTTANTYTNGTVIIMDFSNLPPKLDDAMGYIRDQVSFLLSQFRKSNAVSTEGNNQGSDATAEDMPQFEVVVLLESPGGGAADYGLAAQQLLRLRKEPNVHLTVCVDKVAASGGYMMAVTAHKLLVAPFAVVGSIGVYGETINVHRALEGYGVRPLVFRGGKNKAPVGLVGEVTKEGIANVQTSINAVHRAFQHHVASSRPVLANKMHKIATGDIWLGVDAVPLGLADAVLTSDEYIGQRLMDNARVLKLVAVQRSRLLLGPSLVSPLASTLRSVLSRLVRASAHFLESLATDNVPTLQAMAPASSLATSLQAKSKQF